MGTDLTGFFNPRHIAIVGVTRSNFSFGGISFLQKLREASFAGALYPINPKASEINGLKVYPSLSSLPVAADLAIVCVPAGQVPGVLEECCRRGVRHVHILTAGFKETGTEEGIRLEEQIASFAKEKGLLIIGPNCMGAYRPGSGLTPWGAIPGASGPLGIISQSGTLVQRLVECAYSMGLGTDKAVSVGNEAGLSNLDFLEFMAGDKNISVIALYIESVRDGRRLFELAKTISRKKPIIVFRGGKTEVGARTAASHTGGMAGNAVIWEAFLRQTGVVQVDSVGECTDAVLAFAFLQAPASRGVFLIGGGGGTSVVASDTCLSEGLDVPHPSPATMERLRKTVPQAGSIAGNPLDDWKTFIDPVYLAAVLDLVYEDPGTGMIIVDKMIPRNAFHTPQRFESVGAVIEEVKKRERPKPLVFVVDSEGGDPELAAKGARWRAEFGRAGIPAYPSLKRAARALMHLYRYYSRFA